MHCMMDDELVLSTLYFAFQILLHLFNAWILCITPGGSLRCPIKSFVNV